jgi:hypothetical protein
MKIDDLFDKTLATGSNMTRKSKSAGKLNPEATVPAETDKLQKGAKSKAGTNYVDKYESRHESSESTMRTESSSSIDLAPIRKDRVERARQLVAAGAYNSQDVTDKIIDRLLETIREA